MIFLYFLLVKWYRRSGSAYLILMTVYYISQCMERKYYAEDYLT